MPGVLLHASTSTVNTRILRPSIRTPVTNGPSIRTFSPQSLQLTHFLQVEARLLGDDADLGVGSVILPGVHIGLGAQIGAGAVVASDVPPYAVVAGVPARLIRMRKVEPGD